MLRIWVIALSILFLAVGCKKAADNKPAADAAPAGKPADPGVQAGAGQPGKPSEPPKRPQVPAPTYVAEPPADAKKTPLGVFYKVLTPGKEGGPTVGKNDLVTLNFTVWSRKGETKHSTSFRNKPDSFPLGAVPMRDLADGLTGMKVGEKRRLWSPQELAYAGQGAPGEALTYEVEVMETKQVVPDPKDLTAPASAQKGPEDTKYIVVTKGSGKGKAVEEDQVKMMLSEWSPDGRLRRSTLMRGKEPAQMAVKSMPPPLRANVMAMAPGEKRQIWSEAKAGAPADMARLYEIEVVEIMKMPPPPAAPKDVAAPPKNAKKTKNGVSYVVQKPGNGKDHPTAMSEVTVHYTGWTTDGKMFDSSVTRGQPATFGLNRVIPGWTEGLQTMVVGEKTRFWIPKELAYEGRSGPQGMLVFDVELLAIPKPGEPGTDASK